MRSTSVVVADTTRARLGKVTKAALRMEFKQSDDLAHFVTIGDMFGTRGGLMLTAREAAAQGIDCLEVREGDRLVAGLYLHPHPSGAVYVDVQ